MQYLISWILHNLNLKDLHVTMFRMCQACAKTHLKKMSGCVCVHVQLYNTFTDYNIRHDSSCGSNVMSFSNSPKKNVITQAIANFVILI
ncbi:uncharacterized protein LOC107265208 isoform X2 [Cephus cinctus]|uniref:Uncharacterized protein LOC107265208 isoform X2 n=1 Tax=Cephus cinctus TaxID=211228 RepID=A0AAJ7BMP0_CEPCN|nr:uncharacterized protein LOC107265208 isoform X2 [Cephus cinctus]